ncbi:MAG: bifunctional phosphoglucose/phosphomannose isomerase [Fimbriimonadaceae bacterium]
MHLLDDPSFITRHDPKGMYDLTCRFPEQCREALGIARAALLADIALNAKIVALAGLGGSAAGGDLTKALFEAHAGVAFTVVRDYHVPSFVGVGDLVFCSSYSGNTEETLSAYASAKRGGAKVIALTSGGKLAELASDDGHPVITIPGGQPPRTALGYMMVPIVVACERLSLLPPQGYDAAFDLLDKCVAEWSAEVPLERNEAKQIAKGLHNKVPVLYGLGSWQGYVANRWKGQINENAKNLALCSTFPELNHNEILGWVRAGDQGVAAWSGVILEDGSESAKMKARAEVTSGLLAGICPMVRARAKGESLLEKMLSLTLLGDFVSLYMAALNGVDPENIDWINTLKSELAKVQ